MTDAIVEIMARAIREVEFGTSPSDERWVPAAAAALSALREAGYAVVPRGATEKMREAGRLANMNAIGGYDGPDAWSAMVEAAEEKA